MCKYCERGGTIVEEIKVGNFIRTKDGVIAKVTYVDVMMVDCDRDVFDLNNLAMMEIPTEYIEEYIVKHSSNIIDLIEVGDYVNGSEVVAEKYTNYDMDFINVDSEISFGWGYGVIPENDIKSIVTKEKFESEIYRLEE